LPIVSRYPIDLILLVVVTLIQAAGVRLLWSTAAARASQRVRTAIIAGAAFSFTILLLGVMIQRSGLAGSLPVWITSWGRGMVAAWALASSLTVAGLAIARLIPVRAHHSPSRRVFLQTTQAALVGAPVIATGYGVFIQRYDFRLREQDVPIPNLPPDLDGLRLVQLTDIHLSPFLSLRELDHTIAMANETRAHVALVTGDLITRGDDPLEDCLKHLSGLRADAGVYGCLGNHEIYAGAEAYTTRRAAELGMRFLRHQAEPLRFGSATLNLAGVDYQRIGTPYLQRAESLVRPDAVNVLLSHNPDVFPVAARKGFPLTVSGHTHGGQIRFEILRQDVSIVRFITPYVDGLYRENGSSIFVSRGIGTIALPARLGAPPEVALLRLCRT
jgi:predicted MPP superfamily phosphohydrolase